MTDDKAIHGGAENTARDTEQALRRKIEYLQTKVDGQEAYVCALEAQRDRAAEIINRLRAALEPFAKFNDALKEWRFGPSNYLLQAARSDRTPVLRWIEPLPPPDIPGEIPESFRTLEVWASDFQRAEQALKVIDHD